MIIYGNIFDTFTEILKGRGTAGEKADYVWEQEEKEKPAQKFTRTLLSLVITLVVGAVYFYITLPALNVHSEDFYIFVFLLCVTYTLARLMLGKVKVSGPAGYLGFVKSTTKLPLLIVIVMVVVIVVGSLVGQPLFRAAAYADLLVPDTGEFSSEVAEISLNQIPMLDSSSANILANRKLGNLSDLVSQFNVSDDSAQINYNDRPVRVTYLNYDGFFKWFKNTGKGLPAYMIIDMATQDVEVVRLEEGMKYSPSEWFNRKLERALRFRYPTAMFNNVNFEIDEEGTPYWIASVTVKRIGLFGGDDTTGAVLFNAVTGESQYYAAADVPTWVDRVYSADILVRQYNYHGLYINGFLNSYFGQTECTASTEGYNYIAMDDDVWMYTGITSVSSDRGNIGFILINQRTKEARYYSCAGAEEFSAMSSAEGAVQQYAYEATFPLLLNIADEPTYFMALKDSAGLVKMYAMVNVQQYQIVATGNSLQNCQESYRNLLIEKGILTQAQADESEGLKAEETLPAEVRQVSGVIEELRTADMGGDTHFFIRLAGDDTYYVVNASKDPAVVIFNAGDTVTITCQRSEEQLVEATAIVRDKEATAAEEDNAPEPTAPAMSAPKSQPLPDEGNIAETGGQESAE